MKHFSLFAAALLALAIAGCGGSNNNVTPATTGNQIVGSTPRVEAIVRVDPSNLKNPGSYSALQLTDPTQINPLDLIDPTFAGISDVRDTIQVQHPAFVQDPRNIETGQSIVFELVTYDGAGNRTVLQNVTWTSTDPTGTYGTLGNNSGLFLAGNTVNPIPLHINAVFNGQQYSTEFDIKSRQAILVGRVLDENTGLGIAGVELHFYDLSGTFLGACATSYNGSFRASVPVAAAQIQIVSDSIPATYQWDYKAGLVWYHSGDVDCRLTLTSLQVGGASAPAVGINVLPLPIYLRLRTQAVPDPGSFICTQ